MTICSGVIESLARGELVPWRTTCAPTRKSDLGVPAAPGARLLRYPLRQSCTTQAAATTGNTKAKPALNRASRAERHGRPRPPLVHEVRNRPQSSTRPSVVAWTCVRERPTTAAAPASPITIEIGEKPRLGANLVIGEWYRGRHECHSSF